MNASPDKTLLETAARGLRMGSPVLEKDWHVTQVIAILSGIQHSGFEMIFSGGTALSKAHRLIQRFSEDIDFRIITPGAAPSRKARSNLKHAIVDALRASGLHIEEHRVRARDENRFFAIDIDYESHFSREGALRPHIQIEIAAQNIQLPAVYLPVTSFMNEFMKQPPEVARIGCLDPVENAADKMSAIAWRIPDRVRGNPYDDPSIVRHIHDLAMLKEMALKSPAFVGLVVGSMQRDDDRTKNTPSFAGLSMSEKFAQMLSILSTDAEYLAEYDYFVTSTSYSQDGSTPDFKTALEAVKQLIEIATA